MAKRSNGANNAPLKKTLANITAIELPNRHSPGEETPDVLEGGSAAMANEKDKDKSKNGGLFCVNKAILALLFTESEKS